MSKVLFERHMVLRTNLLLNPVLASDPKPRTFQTNRIQRKTKLRRNRYLILIWVIN